MVGTNDLEKAKTFYSALLAEMGAKIVMDVGRGVLYGVKPGEPMFFVATPYNKEPATVGNGSRENVDKLYAKAISLGASDEGAPGERMPNFYGAYFRDLDGNKLAFYHMG
jgi:predicted lactoylglutathione lyase